MHAIDFVGCSEDRLVYLSIMKWQLVGSNPIILFCHAKRWSSDRNDRFYVRL